jgi:hypothetical protein
MHSYVIGKFSSHTCFFSLIEWLFQVDKIKNFKDHQIPLSLKYHSKIKPSMKEIEPKVYLLYF